MILVECVDHGGIDVVYGDAQHNNGHILANSFDKCVPVIQSYCGIAVNLCQIHISIQRTCFRGKKTVSGAKYSKYDLKQCKIVNSSLLILFFFISNKKKV